MQVRVRSVDPVCMEFESARSVFCGRNLSDYLGQEGRDALTPKRNDGSLWE